MHRECKNEADKDMHRTCGACPDWLANTWHDLAVREVASKEIVVGCDIFVADCKLLGLVLHHSVH